MRLRTGGLRVHADLGLVLHLGEVRSLASSECSRSAVRSEIDELRQRAARSCEDRDLATGAGA
jgi:hypothetical protein